MQPSNQLSIPAMPVLGFALTLMMLPGAFAEGPAIPNYSTKTDLQIARDVAPYVYFHENEHNWPYTYENFLFYSQLRRKSDGAYIANALKPEDLNRLTNDGKDSAGYFLDVADWMYGGDADLSRTKPYVRVLNKPGQSVYANNPLTNQPIGPPILTLPAYKEIQFWFFFPFNGCQTHRVHALADNLKYYTSYFQMCDAARHEGDVEAVTVFINQSNGRPMGIATTRHGDNFYTRWEDIKSSGTHPFAYSAWASHAMYTTPGRKGLDSPEMANLARLFCGILNLDSWNIYDLPTADGERWDPTLYSNNLVMMDENTPITKYRGNWGLMGMNNWGVRPPSAPGYDGNPGQVDVVKTVADAKIASCFANLRDVANVFNSLKDKLTGNGTDWFSKNDWLTGMKIDKVGK